MSETVNPATAKPATVIIVEDEPKLAGLIIDYLKADHFDSLWLEDGSRLAEVVRTTNPSLILLDVMLPGVDGFSLCRQIRSFSQIPLVMLTARNQEQDRLLGFESGVDDYICKPFSPRELVFRVKAILKRAEANGPTPYSAAKLAFDFAAYKARLNGKPIDLTPIEFRALTTLAQFPGRVFSRDELLDRVYPGHRIINDRTIDSHIKNLRRKLKAAGAGEDGEILHSIYGLGYKLEFF